MRILRAYILQEHLSPFLVTLGGLTVVMLIGNIIRFAELIISKGVSPLDILRLLIYLIPFLLSFTIPMAALISMILAFGRLSSDYELIALRASGVAPGRLLIPLLTAAVVLSGWVLVLNDRVVPATHLAARQQLKSIGIKRPTAYLEAGTFIKDFPPYVLFIYQLEKKMLFNIRIYEPQAVGPTRTIVANRGEFEPLPNERGVKLMLYDGTVDDWDPAHPGSLAKVSFRTYAMNLALDPEARGRLGKKLKEMTFHELLKERRRMKTEGIDTLPISLEFHHKIASSFATVIFAVFGLALGFRLHHHERLVIYVWVLGLLIAYYLLDLGMNAIALKQWMPA